MSDMRDPLSPSAFQEESGSAGERGQGRGGKGEVGTRPDGLSGRRLNNESDPKEIHNVFQNDFSRNCYMFCVQR